MPGAGVPCESASRKADGDDDATLVLATAGAASGSETCTQWRAVRARLALGKITSTSTAPDQRRDLEEHTGVIER